MKRRTYLQFYTIRYTFFLSLFFVSSMCLANNIFAQTPEQIKYYSERIEFGTDEVKRNALFDLRNFQTETASRIALPALRDSSEIVRATATYSVVYLPKTESAKVLLPLLNEKSEFIRQETAYALGKTRNPDIADKLISILQKDKKQSVRDAAAVSLGLIGNPIALQPLLQILNNKPKDSQKFFRRAAARSIGQIAETIQNRSLTFETPEDFLPSKFKKTENSKYQDLVETKPIFRDALQILTKTLQNKKEFPDVKREAAFALGTFGSKTIAPILKANLDNEDYYLAEICKESLLKIDD